MLTPLLEEFKGYFKLLAFDCLSDEVSGQARFKQVCEKEDHLPFF